MQNDPDDRELDNLFAAAKKAELYSAGREFGFETRLLARIRESRSAKSPFLLWAWRLMPAFATVVASLGIWITVLDPMRAPDTSVIDLIGAEDTVGTSSLAGE